MSVTALAGVPATSVDPEATTDDVDTSPRPEDGPQNVDQEPGYQVAEADSTDQDDPEVHEVA
jgi:hypothetical protein